MILNENEDINGAPDLLSLKMWNWLPGSPWIFVIDYVHQPDKPAHDGAFSDDRKSLHMKLEGGFADCCTHHV